MLCVCNIWRTLEVQLIAVEIVLLMLKRWMCVVVGRGMDLVLWGSFLAVAALRGVKGHQTSAKIITKL